MTRPPESEYDAIAGAYKDSKQLSFRQYIEEYTLFEMLGDISGEKVLDLACGEGFYTRKLKPGRRFVGFNDNVLNAPGGTVSFARYGFEKEYKGTRTGATLAEGDPIVYRFTNDDGTRFEFNNYYLSPGTYRRAFEEAGFVGFRWVDPQLHPSERNNRFWDDFMAAPPIIGFAAVRA